MKKILITGGPVHAYLDDVKIITNKFKGGLMAKLVEDILKKRMDISIAYLCSKDSKQPQWPKELGVENNKLFNVLHHNGLEDYMKKVLKLAPGMNAVVLGAAVCNLIPKNRIVGKFPSHDYKPGDIIPIDFTIAPRVIDQVKKVNPKVHLFGFKLLSEVDYYELISAAYGVLLESKAVTVFANDTRDLDQIYAVTKEKGVHQFDRSKIAYWVINRMSEKYYKTYTTEKNILTQDMKEGQEFLSKLLNSHRHSFIETDEGYLFGSGALLLGDEGFVTTARGKREVEDFAFVSKVDHDQRKVFCVTNKKATLNAPLFHYIFAHLCQPKYILHFHHQREDLKTMEYATPGTDKDSTRPILDCPSFNIEGHGCILSYNKNGELLK